jgi:hypothetical protein
LMVQPCIVFRYDRSPAHWRDEQTAKLPSAARPGHFLFLAKKKVTKEKGLPRQSKPKVRRATGIFRLANPWLGRKTTRIPARRPPGLQSASARILD